MPTSEIGSAFAPRWVAGARFWNVTFICSVAVAAPPDGQIWVESWVRRKAVRCVRSCAYCVGCAGIYLLGWGRWAVSVFALGIGIRLALFLLLANLCVRDLGWRNAGKAIRCGWCGRNPSSVCRAMTSWWLRAYLLTVELRSSGCGEHQERVGM